MPLIERLHVIVAGGPPQTCVIKKMHLQEPRSCIDAGSGTGPAERPGTDAVIKRPARSL